ncbi:MAG: hypothetical protein IPF99_20815 [Deltaproteobacteria bacterium]|nr:hypothetical protein [Deltaproteobacteria bacterium]
MPGGAPSAVMVTVSPSSTSKESSLVMESSCTGSSTSGSMSKGSGSALAECSVRTGRETERTTRSPRPTRARSSSSCSCRVYSHGVPKARQISGSRPRCRACAHASEASPDQRSKGESSARQARTR